MATALLLLVAGGGAVATVVTPAMCRECPSDRQCYDASWSDPCYPGGGSKVTCVTSVGKVWCPDVVAPLPPPPPTPPVRAGAHNHRLIGYLGNWHACPTADEFDQYTHVLVSFAVSYTWAPSKNTCHQQCQIATPVAVCENKPNQALIDELRARGKKVILSFGGAGMGGSWDGDVNDCWDHCFGREADVVAQLKDIAADQKFDGVDIDYEYFYEDHPGRGFNNGAGAQQFLKDVTVTLRSEMGAGFEISHAMMDRDMVPGTAYARIIQELAAAGAVDFVLPQFYNGITNAGATGIAGTMAGQTASALSIYKSLVDDAFGGDATKVLFGFCLRDCSDPVFRTDSTEALAVLRALHAEYPCNGGAFFWVANDDITTNNFWTNAVGGLLHDYRGCPTPAPPTLAPSTPAPPTLAPPTLSPATPAPLTQAPSTPTPLTPSPAGATPAPPTLAPATPAPPTQAPLTQAPLTPAPQTAPLTQAPQTVTPPGVPTTETVSVGTTTASMPTPAPTTAEDDTPAPAAVTPPPATLVEGELCFTLEGNDECRHLSPAFCDMPQPFSAKVAGALREDLGLADGEVLDIGRGRCRESASCMPGACALTVTVPAGYGGALASCAVRPMGCFEAEGLGLVSAAAPAEAEAGEGFPLPYLLLAILIPVVAAVAVAGGFVAKGLRAGKALAMADIEMKSKDVDRLSDTTASGGRYEPLLNVATPFPSRPPSSFDFCGELAGDASPASTIAFPPVAPAAYIADAGACGGASASPSPRGKAAHSPQARQAALRGSKFGPFDMSQRQMGVANGIPSFSQPPKTRQPPAQGGGGMQGVSL